MTEIRFLKNNYPPHELSLEEIKELDTVDVFKEFLAQRHKIGWEIERNDVLHPGYSSNNGIDEIVAIAYEKYRKNKDIKFHNLFILDKYKVRCEMGGGVSIGAFHFIDYSTPNSTEDEVEGRHIELYSLFYSLTSGSEASAIFNRILHSINDSIYGHIKVKEYTLHSREGSSSKDITCLVQNLPLSSPRTIARGVNGRIKLILAFNQYIKELDDRAQKYLERAEEFKGYK